MRRQKFGRNPDTKRIHCALTALSFLALLAAGCAPKKMPAKAGVEYPPPSEIIEHLSGKHLLDKSLKGLARISIRSPQGTYSSTCVVATRLPDSLRVETLPPIGPPDLFFSLKGKRLEVYLPGQGVFFTGMATRQNISRFFPFPIEVREMIPLLMGVLPPDFRGQKVSLKEEMDDDLYRIDVLGGEKIRSLFVNPSRRELVRIELQEPGGGSVYSAKLRDYKRISGVPIPQDVEFRYEDGKGEVSVLRVRFSDLQLSSGEDKALYDLAVPPGVKRQYLD